MPAAYGALTIYMLVILGALLVIPFWLKSAAGQS
jgi:hypothetical protein